MTINNHPLTAGRNPALDGIRGLAAFFVLISHYMPQNKFWWTMQWGKIGVVVFFILSGYLIVGILLSGRTKIEHGHAMKSIWTEFYQKRALRIFPLYFGVLLFFCLIGNSNTIQTFWWHATFTSNFGHALFKLDFDNFSHFWSICIEEQFYLVIPLLVLLFNKRKSFNILFGLFIACTIFKISYALTDLDQSVLARIPISNVEGISFGALIAYSFHSKEAESILKFIIRWLAPCACIIFMAMNIYRFIVGVPAYYTFFNIAIADLVIVGTFGPLVAAVAYRSLNTTAWNFLASKPLTYLGTISYGVYVYHYAILLFLPSLLDSLGIQDMTMTAFFAKCAIAISLAAISWHCFEKQILKLKSRISADRESILSTPR